MNEKCEPPDELRDKRKPFWVLAPSGDLVASQWSPFIANNGYWGYPIHATAENAAQAGWSYKGTIITPAEADALRAERDAAVQGRADYHNMWQEQVVRAQQLERTIYDKGAECIALRARVAVLRDLLNEIEEDAFWARSHKVLRDKIRAALSAGSKTNEGG